MSEYTEKAEEFLKSHGLEFRAVLIGNDCPMFCEDALANRDMDKVNTFPRKTHIHGKHYRCTVSGKSRGHFTLDFWNSYADEAHNATPIWKRKASARANKIPDAYSLFACMQKYDPGTFEDFCGDFGYDTDSRRAEVVL